MAEKTASRRKTLASTKQRNEGSGVASILNPVNGVRDALTRKGVKPKNHHLLNLKAIRAAEAQVKSDRESAAVEAGKERFKMSRFKNIPAKVTAYMPAAPAAGGVVASPPPQPAPALAPTHTDFLRKNTRTDSGAAVSSGGDGMNSQRRSSTSGAAKPAVPTRDELKASQSAAAALAASQPQTDFVRANSREVLKASAALTASKASAAAAPTAAYKDKSDYGKTPAYLLERKLELAADAERRRLASKADSSDVPAGMVKLSESERAQTLEILNAKNTELLNALSQLPMFVETPSIVKKKFAIEQQLKEIEDAIRVFSRKTVYVKA